MKAWKQRAGREPSRQTFKTSQHGCVNQIEKNVSFEKNKNKRKDEEERTGLCFLCSIDLEGKGGDLAAILRGGTPSPFFHAHGDVIRNLLQPV